MQKIILFYCLILVTSISFAQSTINRNLPGINVFAIDNNAFEEGKITIKFNRNYFNKLKIIIDNGIVQFNDSWLDKISQQYKFKKCVSLFSHILQDENNLAKHQQWNFDLWFTIDFDTQKSVKKLYGILKNTHFFEIVEPVYKKHLLEEDAGYNTNYIPNDTKLNDQWHYNNTGQGNGKIGKDIKLLNAWDIETGNPNVLVAVHDMGIQLDHPDLAQNIAIGKSYNFIDNNDKVVIGYHGTHTAGTIAAVNNNGIGVSGIAGGNGNINSGVRLMSMQIFDGNKSGGFAESFIYAADKGAAISSNSWAYDFENIYEIAVLDAIDYFIENAGGTALQGGLMIFAAGNVSSNVKYYPSCYDRVICVAATNNRDTKANYSTYGNWVDISAPGGDYSAATASQVISTTINSGYAGDHGTSMACPHVAGVAALIASKLLGKASASDVRDILLSTTDDIDSLNPNFKGLLGTGRLNAFKALTKAQSIFNNQNVLAIDSFKATNNCNNISLSWKKNSSNDSVIIAYTNTSGIGSLVNGKTYNIGDNLIGQGQIIFKGYANSFVLANNNQPLHYFKIFSVHNNNNYSFGKDATIVSNAYINGSGVIEQNFDFTPYFPTQEWRVINTNNDISWTHTVVDTANTGAGDLYSMCMYNYNKNKILGAVDILTSPIINTKNSDSLLLSFWYAYKYRNTGLPLSDSFEVLVSSDCGNTYSSLWKKAGINLATISNIGDTAFYPFGIDKWKKVVLDLSLFKNNNQLMFAFRSVNGKGNNLFLDNFNIDVRYKNDIELVKILSPINATCNSQITPQIVIRNKGNNSINSLKINYVVDDGNVITTNWNGNVKKDDSLAIQLNSLSVGTGNHTIKIFTFLPNDVTDDFVLNDTVSNDFFITPTASLPLIEGFESNIFPPKNWSLLQNVKDAVTWIKTVDAGSKSKSSAVVQNFIYDAIGNTDDLMTPIFNIERNMDSAFLLFDYANATRVIPTIGEDFDSLEISISKDCGTTWNVIWKKGGSDLRTSNKLFPYKEFFPQANEWNSDSVMIVGSFNKGDNIQLRFRNIEYWGNNIYIDNIKLYSKYYPDGLKQKGYAIYPNPVKNSLRIQHLTSPTNLKEIRLINSIGNITFAQNYDANASNNLIINTASFASGLYILQLIYKDKIVTEKIIKLL